MTAEQQKDAERLERYIIREGLASVMNDTKWREAIQVLNDIMGFNVRFRVKVIRGAEPSADYWDGSFPEHFMASSYKGVEWVEVKTLADLYEERPETGRYRTGKVVDYGDKLAKAFRDKSIPFYQTDGVIRIQGYTRFSQPAAEP